MKGIVTILFLLSAFVLPAQQTVEGSVESKTTALPLESAVVLLLDNKDNTLAYGFTDAKGYFRLTFSAPTDSLFLKISLLGYESRMIRLSKPFRKLDIALNQKDIQLKEVKINPKYVRLKEDTIVYNVSLLQTQNDRNIGEVLKKIPGIEVSQSGGVTYEGNPINTFYIEGMDLLQKKYGIAVNNVPPDAVSEVEVIENHQPVKMLKGEIPSFSAAINLRLKDKSKFRPVGTAEVGGGYGFDDVLWFLNAFGLQAQKNSQSLFMYKTNNTGNDITLELNDQTVSLTERDELRYDPTRSRLLNPAGFSNPPIEATRYLFNQTHTISLNQLWRTGEDKQLRLNVNYMHDARKEETGQFSSYFQEDSAWVMNEYKWVKRRENGLEGVLTYSENSSLRYVDNALKAKLSWSNTLMDIQNQSPVNQQFSRSYLNIQNNLRFNWKSGAKIWNFRSLTGYFTFPQQLEIQIDVTEDPPNQQIERKGFYTYNTSYLIRHIGKSTFRFTGELEATVDNLNTDLKYFAWTDSTKNRLHSDYLRTAFTVNYSYKLKNLTIEATVPVNYYILHLKDKQYHKGPMRNAVYFTPQLRLSYPFSSLTTLTATASYNYNPGTDISDFMSSYILQDYRTLYSTGLQNLTQGIRYSLRLNHKDALHGFYYNISIARNQQTGNRITRQGFKNGIIVSEYAFLNTNSDSWTGLGSISKKLFYQGFSVSLNAQYLQNKSERVQQEILYPVRMQTLLLTPRINAILKRTINLAYEMNFSYMQTAIESPLTGKTKNAHNQYSHKFTGYYFINKKLDFKAQAEYFNNEITASQKASLTFVDLGLVYRHRKFNFELNWNNILNQSAYTYTIYRGLDTYQYTYTLRPQSILASIVFKF